jgi:hypothetical protein
VPIANQLADVIAPAANQPDGTYQVSIHLHPEELGTVHVELHIESGVVNVSVHTEGDATRDLLRQNVGQLRQQLAGSGLATGHFDVESGSAQAHQGDRRPLASPLLPGPSADNQEDQAPLAPDDGPYLLPSVNGALDVRL